MVPAWDRLTSQQFPHPPIHFCLPALPIPQVNLKVRVELVIRQRALISLQVLDKYSIHSRCRDFNVSSPEFDKFIVPGRQVSLRGEILLKAVKCCAYLVQIIHAVEQKAICSRWRVIAVCSSRYKSFPGGGTTEPAIASRINSIGRSRWNTDLDQVCIFSIYSFFMATECVLTAPLAFTLFLIAAMTSSTIPE